MEQHTVGYSLKVLEDSIENVSKNVLIYTSNSCSPFQRLSVLYLKKAAVKSLSNIMLQITTRSN
jgi:predicted transcriptional regulator